MFQNLPNCLLVLDERDHTHLTTALRTDERINLVDFLDQPCPTSAGRFSVFGIVFQPRLFGIGIGIK